MARVKKTISSGESYKMPFPDRLRKLLELPNETQEKLAKAIGANRQSIGQWKDGITSPDVNVLGKIANYYNVSADYLLGRTDVKSPEIDNVAICEKIGLSEEAIQKLIRYNKNTAIIYTKNDEVVFDEVNPKEYNRLSKEKDVSAIYINKYVKTIDTIIKNRIDVIEDISRFLFSEFINDDAESEEDCHENTYFKVREKGSNAFFSIEASEINLTYLLKAQSKLIRLKEELLKESEK